MKKKQKFLVCIILTIILSLCIIAAAIVNLDKIMIRFFPETYLSYMTLNTINKISSESELISSNMPSLKNIYDNHNSILKIDIPKYKLNINQAYDASVPVIYAKGTFNDIEFDGYINNSETGICIPKLSDIYFTFSTSKFGSEFASSTGKSLLPIPIPENLDLTLPQVSNISPLHSADIINAVKILVTDSKINYNDDGSYSLILNSENAKLAAERILIILQSNNSFIKHFEPLKKFAGIDITKDIIEPLGDMILTADIDQNIEARFNVKNGYCINWILDIPSNDSITHISLNFSDGDFLLDNYSASIMIENNGEMTGISYTDTGTKFLDSSNRSQNQQFEFVFGGNKALGLELNIKYDADNNFDGYIDIESDFFETLKFCLNGKLNTDISEINAYKIECGENTVGSAYLAITDFEEINIPSKLKFPFKDLTAEDMVLAAGLIQ